jgi:shikimate dehydrogenase
MSTDSVSTAPKAPRIAPLPPTTNVGESPTGTWRLGVIGDPVAHSISPAFQQAALRELGINATYDRWHTLAADLPARIATFRAPDILGVNVTVPHKQAVMPLLDAITPLAARAGAVNTIVRRGTHLHGDNTDVYGFREALREVRPDIAGSTVLILGAGGATRGVILALESGAPARIIVANRTLARAEQLKADLLPTAIETMPLDDASLASVFPETDILINATSVGWSDTAPLFAPDLFATLPPSALVMDLTYRDTPFLQAARAHHRETLDGFTMLIYQGARSLEIWTGRTAPIAVMRAAGLAARG